MRKLIFVALAVAPAAMAAFPPAVSAQVCNPYTQGSWALEAPVPVTVVRAWGQWHPDTQRFYVLGGRQDDTGLELLNPREYDPTTNTWTTKAATFSDNRVNNMVGGILDLGVKSIVLVGGSVVGGTQTSPEVRFYDPIADSISVIASDPWPPSVSANLLPGGAAVANNRLYVFGGFNNPVAVDNRIWEFDPLAPAGTRWTQKAATLPQPKGYIPAAEAGGFIYLMGGSDWDGATLVDSTQSLRYDPVADTITTIATIPRAVAETRAVRQPLDGSIWVISGGRTAPNPSTEVNAYQPATNTWTTAPTVLNARRNFPADVDPTDGRIFMAGGYDAGGVPNNITEQYTCTIPVDLMTFGIE